MSEECSNAWVEDLIVWDSAFESKSIRSDSIISERAGSVNTNDGITASNLLGRITQETLDIASGSSECGLVTSSQGDQETDCLSSADLSPHPSSFASSPLSFDESDIVDAQECGTLAPSGLQRRQEPNFSAFVSPEEFYDDEKEWDMITEQLAAASVLCSNKDAEETWPSGLYDASTADALSNVTSASSSYVEPKTADESMVNQPRDAKYGFRHTSICKYWQRGICINENCNFAHGKSKLQSTIGVWKTTICQYWKNGQCRVGANCRHAHGEEELQPKNVPAHILRNRLLHPNRRNDRHRSRRNYVYKPKNANIYEAEMEQFAADWSDFATDYAAATNPDDVYFNSYGYIGIHEEMLKDSVRTGAYCRAITQNKHLFHDKIVLDIGCGTGILSLFAVEAGARHVYALDVSNIIQLAQNIAKMNGVADKITFIQEKCEEMTLPVDKVDIIVSEWMGYFLLYENMLPSVLYCRDKWLKPGGLIFPDKARLYIAGIDDAEFKQERFGSWRDLYGFDFTLIKHYLLEEPLVDNVDERAITTNAACILSLDLNVCKAEDTNFCTSILLVPERRDFVHALVAWFDVSFSCCHKPLTLTTSPRAKPTHWKQTVFYIQDDLAVEPGDQIKAKIAVRKSSVNPRDLDVKIWYSFKGKSGEAEYTHFYRIR